MEPLVSIVTPCYNQGQFLEELLESVEMACSLSHEVIVVNDGSSQPLTHRSLRLLQARSPNQSLKIVSRPNGGLSAARNTGLKAARGQFVQLLDADDLLTAGKIDKQLSALQLSGCDVHLCEYAMCDATRTQFSKPDTSTISGFDFTAASFVSNWERGLCIPIHCALFRKNAITNIAFNERLRAKEDWIFWISLAASGAQFQVASFIGAIYRQHDSNMCKDGRSMALSWLRAVKHLLDHGMAMDESTEAGLIDHYNKFYARYFHTTDSPTGVDASRFVVRHTDFASMSGS